MQNETTYSALFVDDALCFFDALLMAREEIPELKEFWSDNGTGQIRWLVCQNVERLEELWKLLPDELTAFDFGFCPAIVSLLKFEGDQFVMPTDEEVKAHFAPLIFEDWKRMADWHGTQTYAYTPTEMFSDDELRELSLNNPDPEAWVEAMAKDAGLTTIREHQAYG
jgi:hypothetical protein